jgi:surface antigen
MANMPPFIHRVSRVTIHGKYAGGVEEWSTGFYLGKENADAALPTQAQVDAIATAWKNFFTGVGQNISASWSTDYVKIASMGTDGRSDAQDTVYSNYVTQPTGSGGNLYPPQIALAASFTSAKMRGVGSHGRMYLPGISIGLDTTGHVGGAGLTAVLGAFKTFINACNAASASGDIVILASHGSINKDGTPKIGGSAPINKAVTGIKIGNVFDTQRRRRNQLAETYQAVSLP